MSETFDFNIGRVVGPPGEPGEDGYSPEVSVSKSGKNTTITITDKAGTTTVTISDGEDGQDGYSPSASVSKNGKTTTITVTDKNGTTTANVLDGEDGSDGEDGVSPEVTITTITGGHRVTITDADHPSGLSFDVMDGQDGAVGVSPEVTITAITGGHRVTITDEAHPTGQSFDVMDGEDGGVVSVNGRTGVVTGLEEALTIVQKTASDTAVTLAADNFYIFPEMSELTITCPATGLYAFRFTSGTTPTVFAMAGITMPDSWEGPEASTVYEMNILNGYALVSKWTVSA